MKAQWQVSASLLLVFVAALSTGVVVAAPKVAEGAVVPITRAQYPKLFAEWGSQGIQRINKLAPLAAKKAAESPECDQVEIVEVSDRSIARKNVVFFVDCANSKRFYIDEGDLKSTAAVRSQEAKTAGIPSVTTVACVICPTTPSQRIVDSVAT